MRVERRGDEYCVVIPLQALEAMKLTEGAEVELRSVVVEPKANGDASTGDSATIRYMSLDEALKAYRETLPQHRDAYQELAK